ncbi:MAG TPA: hypothetical protein VFA57_05055, partial [Pseudolabrys sp.]|nr:hypothetical protein [Pseudolabrys sp.]
MNLPRRIVDISVALDNDTVLDPPFMRAVVGGEVDLLDRPAFAVGQLLRFQAGKQRRQQRAGVLAGLVLNFRPHKGRVEHGVVVERDRDVDDTAGQVHCGLAPEAVMCGGCSTRQRIMDCR